MIFLAIVAVLVLLALVLLYQISGLKEYYQTVTSINRLDSESKVGARDYFYVADASTYRGTLAFIDARGLGAVWVWGKQGLKRFAANQNTVFSFYETCSPEILNKIQSEGVTIDDRAIYTDIEPWNSKVNKGDFIDVTFSTSEVNGTVSSVKEVYGYDSWWPFAPIILEDICGK